MQELERMINIYHTAYIVCLVFAIVFLVLTVFLFFKFDIRKIIDIKTGRGAKRSIQKMEEINARTGKLRQDMVARTPSRLKAEDRITYPPTAENPKVHAQVAAQNAGTQGQKTVHISDPSGSDYTQPLGGQGSENTTILSDSSETTILCQEDPETTVLSQNPLVESQPEKKALPGMFKIEKEILWVHTKEVL